VQAKIIQYCIVMSYFGGICAVGARLAASKEA